MTSESTDRGSWRVDEAARIETTPGGGVWTLPGRPGVAITPHELEALLAFANPKSIRRVLTMTEDAKRPALRSKIDQWIEIGLLTAAQPTHGATPVATMFNSASPSLFFVYSGTQGGVMMSPLAFLQESGLSRENVVLLKDPSQTWFLEGISSRIDSWDALIGWHFGLLDGVSHVKRRYCVGSSMGAFAAIVFGHTLGVDTVWCFGLNRTRAPVLNARGDLWDVARLLAESNGVTRYQLHFNESWLPDREAALKLAGLPGVELFPHDGEGHMVLSHLVQRRALREVFPHSAHTRSYRSISPLREVNDGQVLAVLGSVLPQYRDVLRVDSELTDRLDSLALVLLLERIEIELGVSLEIERLVPADFESVGAITRAIARTQKS